MDLYKGKGTTITAFRRLMTRGRNMLVARAKYGDTVAFSNESVRLS